MASIPRDPAPDATLAFLREGYEFGRNRFDKLDTDVFRTRLLLRETILLRGEAAARLFYDPERFQRSGAAPYRLIHTLLGKGGVQGLDGERHRARKAMPMGLMTPQRIQTLADLVAEEWKRALPKWRGRERVKLFDELHPVLLRAVCRWSGVPVDDEAFDRHVRDVAAMIDGSGGIGPRYWRARIGERANGWAKDLVRRQRAGELKAGKETALGAVAGFQEPDGEHLSEHDAAVDLLNILRPTVAIARWITFAAHALHEHPELRERVRDDEAYRGRFIQEVRRTYPPLVTAIVKQDFTWQGYAFSKGTRTILDLWATDHHRGLWHGPARFDPDRFAEREPTPFDLIPQGGGDYWKNHRCAGEWVTLAILGRSLQILTREMAYTVPEQDLSIKLSRLPAIPKSRLVIEVS